MPNIIRKSQLEHRVHYSREFVYATEPGAGFSFKCDKVGRVRRDRMTKAARANYEQCLKGSVDGREVIDKGLRIWRQRVLIPAIIRCACGGKVLLMADSNVCYKCHQWYNMSGQLLADPRFWGEETGESITEIMMADFNATNY